MCIRKLYSIIKKYKIDYILTTFYRGTTKKTDFNVNFVLNFYNLSQNTVYRFQLTLFLFQKIRNYTY